MGSPRRFNRRGVILAISLLTILISFLFVVPTKAISICQPGEVCTFYLAPANTPCGFNERHFFNDFGNSWEFDIGEQKRITDKFGKFAQADNYAWTAHSGGGGIYGGCVCDTSSWLNYVAKINGFTSFAESNYADAYTQPQVPDEFSVTIDVDDYGNGSNLQLTNSSDQKLTLKWTVNEGAGTVSIWVEKGNQTQALSSELIVLEAPVIDDSISVPPKNDSESRIPNDDSNSILGLFPGASRIPNQDFISFAKISFGLLCFMFLFSIVKSKKFRNGVISLTLIVLVIAITTTIFILISP